MIIQTDKPLRKRHEHDFYPSPDWIIEAALDLAPALPATPGRVLDPGAGEGVWGTAARHRWPECWLVGVELRDVPPPKAYDEWCGGKPFPAYGGIDAPYDLILGNPPYRQAEEFIHASLDLLAPNGTLIFLLRLAFLEGQRRRDSLYHKHPPAAVHVCSRRPSFTGDGKTDATAYAVFVWRKCWRGVPSLKWLKEGPSGGR